VIVGLGIDLEHVARFEQLLERWGERFEAKVFTPAERSYARSRGRPAQHLAARFAAKEAALKALGVPRGLSWHELEVSHGQGGAPQLVLCGGARLAALRLGVDKTHVSLTHTDQVVAAVVILEGGA
jgi:holo-[acyl-carrier protein] synthase